MILTDTQRVLLSVSWVDAIGNPVPNPDNDELTFTSSDETVITVTDNGDGTAWATTTGTLGSVTVTASDDLDADGNPDFLGSIAIDVAAGDVVGITVTAGTPEPRP